MKYRNFGKDNILVSEVGLGSWQIAKNDHRTYNRDGEYFNVGETFGGLPYEKGLELVDELRDLFPQAIPMAQSAVHWCLDQPGVSVIIPGASKVSPAKSNAQVSELASFTAKDLAKLFDFYQQKVHSHIRGIY